MKYPDFRLGYEFMTETGRWRCTDVGSRTIIAIRIAPVEVATIESEEREIRRLLSQTEAEMEGWFNGPPYALAEQVFDEYHMEACEPIEIA